MSSHVMHKENFSLPERLDCERTRLGFDGMLSGQPGTVTCEHGVGVTGRNEDGASLCIKEVRHFMNEPIQPDPMKTLAMARRPNKLPHGKCGNPRVICLHVGPRKDASKNLDAV